MKMEYTTKYAPTVIPQYPKHNSSGSNTTMAYEHERFRSNPMITEYNANDDTIVVTLNINANSSRSQGNHQYTNINDDDTVEAGNEKEILCTQVTLLLKVPARKNACNSKWNLLQ